MINNNDGTFRLTYLTTLSGTYKVDVRINGFSLGDSPFTLVVTAQVSTLMYVVSERET